MTSSMRGSPRLTVLMSCYNATRWLDEAIQSVLTQTLTEYEFIIVDDGSSDDTLEVIQRYAAADPRIIVIEKSNSGLANSLNVGIQEARGEWIARLDADDICEPTRLQKQMALATTNADLVFIGTGLTIINEEGVKLASHRYPARHAELLQNLKAARKFPPHASALYRTESVRAVGGYRSRIHRAEDWDLWLRLSEVGELACLGDPLVQIRKHPGQISHSEKGMRQISDSRLAMVAYWLRQLNFADPIDGDTTDYENFHTWVRARLDADGLFAFAEHRAQLRSIFYRAGATASPIGAINFIVACCTRPSCLLRLFHERLFGETLTRHLATEWVALSRACEEVGV